MGSGGRADLVHKRRQYVLADRQLVRFKRRPESRGKTCREGWWRYSRHPNYFFEWLHWWSYVALAAGSSYWWVTLLAPAAMLHFLLNVTGIPPTEAQALASRGEDYRQYQRTTSVFIPWFPKKEIHPTRTRKANDHVLFEALLVGIRRVLGDRHGLAGGCGPRILPQAIGLPARPAQLVGRVSFYLLFVAGLLVFVIVPAWRPFVRKALLLGGFFGLVAYATYDLTNQATVKDWPWILTIVDMTWGRPRHVGQLPGIPGSSAGWGESGNMLPPDTTGTDHTVTTVAVAGQATVT